MDKRLFSRVEVDQSCVVECGSVAVASSLRNLSLRGALVELGGDLECRRGDACRLQFHLANRDYLMQFGGEIVHANGNLSGIRFVDADLNTIFHLRNLLEAITGNADQLMREIDLLFAEDQLLPGFQQQ